MLMMLRLGARGNRLDDSRSSDDIASSSRGTGTKRVLVSRLSSISLLLLRGVKGWLLTRVQSPLVLWRRRWNRRYGVERESIVRPSSAITFR